MTLKKQKKYDPKAITALPLAHFDQIFSSSYSLDSIPESSCDITKHRNGGDVSKVHQNGSHKPKNGSVVQANGTRRYPPNGCVVVSNGNMYEISSDPNIEIAPRLSYTCLTVGGPNGPSVNSSSVDVSSTRTSRTTVYDSSYSLCNISDNNNNHVHQPVLLHADDEMEPVPPEITNGHTQNDTAKKHVHSQSENGHVHNIKPANEHVLNMTANGHSINNDTNGHVDGQTTNGNVLNKATNGHVRSKATNGRSINNATNGHVINKTENGHVINKIENGHVQNKATNGHISNGNGSIRADSSSCIGEDATAGSTVLYPRDKLHDSITSLLNKQHHFLPAHQLALFTNSPHQIMNCRATKGQPINGGIRSPQPIKPSQSWTNHNKLPLVAQQRTVHRCWFWIVGILVVILLLAAVGLPIIFDMTMENSPAINITTASVNSISTEEATSAQYLSNSTDPYVTTTGRL